MESTRDCLSHEVRGSLQYLLWQGSETWSFEEEYPRSWDHLAEPLPPRTPSNQRLDRMNGDRDLRMHDVQVVNTSIQEVQRNGVLE